MPTGIELEESLRVQREFEQMPALAGLRTGGVGKSLSVPFNAFIGRRDLSVSGGTVLFGRPVEESLGLLQWSSVARSGATISYPLCSSLLKTFVARRGNLYEINRADILGCRRTSGLMS